MNIVGIDPGLGGAIAVLWDGAIQVHDMPTVEIRGKRHVSPAGVRAILDGR